MILTCFACGNTQKNYISKFNYLFNIKIIKHNDDYEKERTCWCDANHSPYLM